MKNTTAVIFCLIISVCLSCNSSKSVNKISDLTSKQWNLNALNGKIPDANSPDYKNPYIRFTPDNVFSGFTGCNSFTGSYKYESGKLTLDPGAITKIYCGEGIEIERVARLVILAQVLEGHGKARLAGAVVGEDENSLFLLLTQILRQRIEVGKGLDIIIFCHSLIQLLRK